MVLVAGADAARVDGRSCWVVAAVRGGHLEEIALASSLPEILDTWTGLDVLAVDIPIGHEDRDGEANGGRRAADDAARERLGPRSASVFPVPPIDLLDAQAHGEAVDAARDRGTIAPSVQVWNLREQILEATHLSGDDDRLHEAHPEVSFHVMSVGTGRLPAKLAHKRSWNGLFQRIGLLERENLAPPRELDETGAAPPDDVLDAIAAAWTADRIATGDAVSFPATPPTDPETGRRVAIHA